MNDSQKAYLYDQLVGGCIKFGDEFVVLDDHCSTLVEYCTKFKIAVLGIDGFTFAEEGTRIPNLNEIADFSSISLSDSWDSYCKATLIAAHDFLSAMDAEGTSDGYSFVLSSKPRSQRD